MKMIIRTRRGQGQALSLTKVVLVAFSVLLVSFVAFAWLGWAAMSWAQ